MSMNKLSAEHLIKRFKTRTIVDNVSIEINEGEIVGLLGPNGAGKTTCFYMMVGLIPCDHGSVCFNDKPITQLPMYTRARLGIGYLPQEASVFRKMSVKDNILSILELHPALSEKEREMRCDNLLSEFNIKQIKDSLGQSLSGGERRRVEIARALAMEPKFILLDEPFAGVDPISVMDIKQIIKHLKKRGIGVLITDHNVRETLDICERAYIMSSGQILCEGSPKEILQNQRVKEVYLGENFDL